MDFFKKKMDKTDFFLKMLPFIFLIRSEFTIHFNKKHRSQLA